jgi:acylphosphatase
MGYFRHGMGVIANAHVLRINRGRITNYGDGNVAIAVAFDTPLFILFANAILHVVKIPRGIVVVHDNHVFAVAKHR